MIPISPHCAADMWRRSIPTADPQGLSQPTKFSGNADIVNNGSQPTASWIRAEDLSPHDVIVALVGPTGSGKSSFIEKATGVTGLAGHGLASPTTKISVIRLSFPGLDLCFVDTPGFDGTNEGDSSEALRMISRWLNHTYKRKIRLTGLLYFHRISDNRMAGAPLTNQHLFEKLCGNDFKGIVLTTSMWDEEDEQSGSERERELKDVYWRSMIERGSSVKRFLFSRKSAFEILSPFFDEVDKRTALLLHRERHDLQSELGENSAGKTLNVELLDRLARHQVVLEEIQRQMRDPMADGKRLRDLMEEYQKLSVQLQHGIEGMQTMKTSMGRRIYRFDIINWTAIISIFAFKKTKEIGQVDMDVGNEREGEVEVRNSARVHMMNLWVAKEKQVMENMNGAVVNQQQVEEAAMELGERETSKGVLGDGREKDFGTGVEEKAAVGAGGVGYEAVGNEVEGGRAMDGEVVGATGKSGFYWMLAFTVL